MSGVTEDPTSWWLPIFETYEGWQPARWTAVCGIRELSVQDQSCRFDDLGPLAAGASTTRPCRAPIVPPATARSFPGWPAARPGIRPLRSGRHAAAPAS